MLLQVIVALESLQQGVVVMHQKLSLATELGETLQESGYSVAVAQQSEEFDSFLRRKVDEVRMLKDKVDKISRGFRY